MEERVEATRGKALEGMGTQAQTLDLSKKPRINETIIQALLFTSGAISILTTLGIVSCCSPSHLNSSQATKLTCGNFSREQLGNHALTSLGYSRLFLPPSAPQ